MPLELYTTDGRLLTFLSTVTTFGTALDLTAAELSIEAFLPANEQTSAQCASVLFAQRYRRQPLPPSATR